MIIQSAKYEAEIWAAGKTNKQLETEIEYIKSLWSSKLPNPFPKNAHHSYSRGMTLREILKNRPKGKNKARG